MSSDRVAALIISYNMPERAEALAAAIRQSAWPVDPILIDNGSDLMPPAPSTTLFLPQNVQTTQGWLAGVNYARAGGPGGAQPKRYGAYMFIITSAEIISGDPVADCADFLFNTPDTVGIHPALTEDSTTIWHHMKPRGKGLPVVRPTWMIDNICSMYRADFFDAHPFDPALVYAHGIDLEICYLARKAKKSLWIHEGSRVRKITDIGYSMGRMNMTASERNHNAQVNMAQVLGGRYGPDYWNFLTTAWVTEGMK